MCTCFHQKTSFAVNHQEWPILSSETGLFTKSMLNGKLGPYVFAFIRQAL